MSSEIQQDLDGDGAGRPVKRGVRAWAAVGALAAVGILLLAVVSIAALMSQRNSVIPIIITSQPRVEIRNERITWEAGSCNNLFFPGPPQYVTYAFELANWGDVDANLRVAFLVDSQAIATGTYFVRAGSVRSLSERMPVQDCDSHTAGLEIAEIWVP